MISDIQKRRSSLTYRVLCAFIAFAFAFSVIAPPSPVFAQAVPLSILNLPLPGTMVPLSAPYMPTLVRGIIIHPDNPLKFDFLVSPGDDNLTGTAFREESRRLIKYFLAGLTVPDQELWVNLSPYEKNRVISDKFGQTEMGRDMLAQDYILKQLSASLMYPENELGKKFWDRVYKKAYERYGTTEIPMNTFSKIWIVPEKAVVYEHDQTAFVVESRLKVMLEEDYVALAQQQGGATSRAPARDGSDDKIISGLPSEVVREILIPEIEKEVNEGEVFTQLRQIYNSVILATWYKDNLRESLLGQVYVDKGKTKGVDIADPAENQKIYGQYLEAFEKGVYNYIREDYDPATKQVIPRKYFSGGNNFIRTAALREDVRTVTPAQVKRVSSPVSKVEVDLLEENGTGANAGVVAEAEKRMAADEPAASSPITADEIFDDVLKFYETEGKAEMFPTYHGSFSIPAAFNDLWEAQRMARELKEAKGNWFLRMLGRGLQASTISNMQAEIQWKRDAAVQVFRNAAQEEKAHEVSKRNVLFLAAVASQLLGEYDIPNVRGVWPGYLKNLELAADFSGEETGRISAALKVGFHNYFKAHAILERIIKLDARMRDLEQLLNESNSFVVSREIQSKLSKAHRIRSELSNSYKPAYENAVEYLSHAIAMHQALFPGSAGRTSPVGASLPVVPQDLRKVTRQEIEGLDPVTLQSQLDRITAEIDELSENPRGYARELIELGLEIQRANVQLYRELIAEKTARAKAKEPASSPVTFYAFYKWGGRPLAQSESLDDLKSELKRMSKAKEVQASVDPDGEDGKPNVIIKSYNTETQVMGGVHGQVDYEMFGSVIVAKDIADGIEKFIRAEEAKRKLKTAFEDNNHDQVIVISDRPLKTKMLGIDWDGVITKETGYHDTAWAAMMVMIENGADNISVQDLTTDDLERGRIFREKSRGVETAIRFDQLREKAVAAGIPKLKLKSDREYLEKYYEIVLESAKKEFGEDFDAWVYPNSGAFLEYLDAGYANIPRHVISAIPQEVIESVISRFSVKKYITGLHGQPLRSKEGETRNKTTIITELRENRNLEVDEFAFLGDSPSDIEFGKNAGVITVGVANTYENGVKLIDAGTDIIIPNLYPKETLMQILQRDMIVKPKTTPASSPVLKPSAELQTVPAGTRKYNWETAGKRGEMGALEFSLDNAGREAAGFAEEALARKAAGQHAPMFGREQYKILVAFDARGGTDDYAPGGSEDYARRVASVISAFEGFDVDLHETPLPTPVVAGLTQEALGEGAYDFAFHITGSHIQLSANGIKFLYRGTVNEDEWTQPFSRRANEKEQYPIDRAYIEKRVNYIEQLEAFYNEVFPTILNSITSYKERFPQAKFSIDLMHGGAVAFAHLFEQWGLDVARSEPMRDVADQMKREGILPDPTQSKNYINEPRFIRFRDTAADGSIHFIIDGDGDRVVTLVKVNGGIDELQPNNFGPMATNYLIENDLAPEGANLLLRSQVTSRGVDALADVHGLTVEVVPVGSKHFNEFVVQEEGSTLLSALEESGHFVFRRKYADQSGNTKVIMFFDDTIAQVAQMLEIMGSKKKTISELVKETQELTRYAGKYVRRDPKLTDELAQRLLEPLAGDPQSLLETLVAAHGRTMRDVKRTLIVVTRDEYRNKIVTLEEFLKGGLELRPKEGIIVEYHDLTWGGTRISGTGEPVLRNYSEGLNEAQRKRYEMGNNQVVGLLAYPLPEEALNAIKNGDASNDSPGFSKIIEPLGYALKSVLVPGDNSKSTIINAINMADQQNQLVQVLDDNGLIRIMHVDQSLSELVSLVTEKTFLITITDQNNNPVFVVNNATASSPVTYGNALKDAQKYNNKNPLAPYTKSKNIELIVNLLEFTTKAPIPLNVLIAASKDLGRYSENVLRILAQKAANISRTQKEHVELEKARQIATAAENALGRFNEAIERIQESSRKQKTGARSKSGSASSPVALESAQIGEYLTVNYNERTYRVSEVMETLRGILEYWSSEDHFQAGRNPETGGSLAIFQLRPTLPEFLSMNFNASNIMLQDIMRELILKNHEHLRDRPFNAATIIKVEGFNNMKVPIPYGGSDQMILSEFKEKVLPILKAEFDMLQRKYGSALRSPKLNLGDAIPKENIAAHEPIKTETWRPGDAKRGVLKGKDGTPYTTFAIVHFSQVNNGFYIASVFKGNLGTHIFLGNDLNKAETILNRAKTKFVDQPANPGTADRAIAAIVEEAKKNANDETTPPSASSPVNLSDNVDRASSPLTFVSFEKEMAAIIGNAYRTPLNPESPDAGIFVQDGFGKKGHGMNAGAAINGTEATEGDQGEFVRSIDPSKFDGARSGREFNRITTAAIRELIERRTKRIGKAIRGFIKAGIGGQHTPFQAIADLVELADSSKTYKFYGAYELGRDTGTDLREITDDLSTTDETLVSLSQIIEIADSKSGGTDETMLNFLRINRFDFEDAANTDGFNGDAFAVSYLDYLHKLNVQDGKDRPTQELFKGFNLEDLTAEIRRGAEQNAEITSDQVKEILGRVLGSMYFQTTNDITKSRLAAFIQNSGLDRILGEDRPRIGVMFENVGGRWTFMHHIRIFLAAYNLNADSVWEAANKTIREVVAGKHKANEIGNFILDHRIENMALVVPKGHYWFGKSMEQNFNESNWAPGSPTLIVVEEEDWAGNQDKYYTDKGRTIVINLTELDISPERHNVFNIGAVKVPEGLEGHEKMQDVVEQITRLFYTFYGIASTVGYRLNARAVMEVGYHPSEVNPNQLNNPATRVFQRHSYLRQPIVELGKGFLEKALESLQSAYQTWLKSGGIGSNPIQDKVRELIQEARERKAVTNIGALKEIFEVKGITGSQNFVEGIRQAVAFAKKEGRISVVVLYLEGKKFMDLSKFLKKLGVQVVLQGTGDQHINLQHIDILNKKFLPIFASFIPEENNILDFDPKDADPAVGFGKAYLHKAPHVLIRDQHGESSYKALVEGRDEEGRLLNGEAVFFRFLDTPSDLEEFKSAFETVANEQKRDFNPVRVKRGLNDNVAQAAEELAEEVGEVEGKTKEVIREMVSLSQLPTVTFEALSQKVFEQTDNLPDNVYDARMRFLHARASAGMADRRLEEELESAERFVALTERDYLSGQLRKAEVDLAVETLFAASSSPVEKIQAPRFERINIGKGGNAYAINYDPGQISKEELLQFIGESTLTAEEKRKIRYVEVMPKEQMPSAGILSNNGAVLFISETVEHLSTQPVFEKAIDLIYEELTQKESKELRSVIESGGRDRAQELFDRNPDLVRFLPPELKRDLGFKEYSITRVVAREILDSRGNPTVEVEVFLANGQKASAKVPSGASTGEYEALELRDKNNHYFNGNGVFRAIGNVNKGIAPHLIGLDIMDPEITFKVDNLLIALDGTADKSNLGANGILGISLAVAHAAAQARGVKLENLTNRVYSGMVGKEVPMTLPIPMKNILNGGSHVPGKKGEKPDIQEIMEMAVGAKTFKQARDWGRAIYAELERILIENGYGPKDAKDRGNEKGFRPPLKSNEQALEFVNEAVKRAGEKAGFGQEDVLLTLDVASSEPGFYDPEKGLYDVEGVKKTPKEMNAMYAQWFDKYPQLYSIEDGFAEDDWPAWIDFQKEVVAPRQRQSVGDDLYVTNPIRLARGIELIATNAVLIKLNQIGTFTETLAAIKMAKEAGYAVILSHRSGETDDTSLMAIAIGTGAGQVKTGADYGWETEPGEPTAKDRISKYDYAERLEAEMAAQGTPIPYAGTLGPQGYAPRAASSPVEAKITFSDVTRTLFELAPKGVNEFQRGKEISRRVVMKIAGRLGLEEGMVAQLFLDAGHFPTEFGNIELMGTLHRPAASSPVDYEQALEKAAGVKDINDTNALTLEEARAIMDQYLSDRREPLPKIVLVVIGFHALSLDQDYVDNILPVVREIIDAVPIGDKDVDTYKALKIAENAISAASKIGDTSKQGSSSPVTPEKGPWQTIDAGNRDYNIIITITATNSPKGKVELSKKGEALFSTIFEYTREKGKKDDVNLAASVVKQVLRHFTPKQGEDMYDELRRLKAEIENKLSDRLIKPASSPVDYDTVFAKAENANHSPFDPNALTVEEALLLMDAHLNDTRKLLHGIVLVTIGFHAHEIEKERLERILPVVSNTTRKLFNYLQRIDKLKSEEIYYFSQSYNIANMVEIQIQQALEMEKLYPAVATGEIDNMRYKYKIEIGTPADKTNLTRLITLTNVDHNVRRHIIIPRLLNEKKLVAAVETTLRNANQNSVDISRFSTANNLAEAELNYFNEILKTRYSLPPKSSSPGGATELSEPYEIKVKYKINVRIDYEAKEIQLRLTDTTRKDAPFHNIPFVLPSDISMNRSEFAREVNTIINTYIGKNPSFKKLTTPSDRLEELEDAISKKLGLARAVNSKMNRQQWDGVTAAASSEEHTILKEQYRIEADEEQITLTAITTTDQKKEISFLPFSITLGVLEDKGTGFIARRAMEIINGHIKTPSFQKLKTPPDRLEALKEILIASSPVTLDQIEFVMRSIHIEKKVLTADLSYKGSPYYINVSIEAPHDAELSNIKRRIEKIVKLLNEKKDIKLSVFAKSGDAIRTLLMILGKREENYISREAAVQLVAAGLQKLAEIKSAASSPVKEFDKSKMVIYYADSNDIWRHLIVDMLTREGYEIRAFKSGVEIITQMQEGNVPDLVVINNKVPKDIGVRMIKYLKQWDNKIPMIMVSGLPDIKKDWPLKAIFDKSKFERREFLKSVESILRGKSSEPASSPVTLDQIELGPINFNEKTRELTAQFKLKVGQDNIIAKMEIKENPLQVYIMDIKRLVELLQTMNNIKLSDFAENDDPKKLLLTILGIGEVRDPNSGSSVENLVAEGLQKLAKAVSSPVTNDPVGGIDFNPALMDLQIKRDGNGIPLPFHLQPIEVMNIEGLIPVIINVTPVLNVPLLLGLGNTGQQGTAEDAARSTLIGPMEPRKQFKAVEPEQVSYLPSTR